MEPLGERAEVRLEEPRVHQTAIVNISSVHQLITKPSYLSYSVSKGGMQNLTRTLALEYAGRGIRVNAVGPARDDHAHHRAWVDDPVTAEMVTSHIPMPRPGKADEMAGVVALPRERRRRLPHRPDDLRRRGAVTLFADFREPWSPE